MASSEYRQTVNGRRTPTYYSWRAMRNRCTNPHANNWKYYGARGISVCLRWSKFDDFVADMGERPPGTTLDRKNGEGNYEPGNCRWVTRDVQRLNQRSNVPLRFVFFRGKTQCISAWAKETGISRFVIADRLKRGWGLEKTFSTAVAYRRPFGAKVAKHAR